MSARRAVPFRFAVLGFAVTAAFLSYQLITDSPSAISRNPVVMTVFVVLCPPSVLSLSTNDAEVGSNAFYFLWAFIGLLNAALYASVRAIIMCRLKKVD